MRASRFLILAIFVLAATTACLASSRDPQVDTGFGPLPVFEFHSGFWTNLHHTLYFEARQRGATSAPAKTPGSSRSSLDGGSEAKRDLSEAERRTWNDAVAYYAANIANRDLLFSNDLIDLNNQLSDFEDCPELSGTGQKFCNAGLPAEITRVLESAAPVYRKRFWPAHDRENRRWILAVAPLVREQGLGLAERLADIYEAPWPRRKIRVDVSVYANWAGAYTTTDPLHVTISSSDPGNQGRAALEVLFHEASHGIAQGVESAIIRECRQRDKAIPRDLWHALLFYTTGEVLRPILANSAKAAYNNAGSSPASAGSNAGAASVQRNHAREGDGSDSGSNAKNSDGYTPYAFAHGLYQRGWQNYLDLLERFWQPYLDGRVSFEDAIAHIVSAL